MTEDEKSLAKRPELIPDKLKEGGVIVGVEPSVTGSLVSMSGLALERITRERLGSPFKLPERSIYLLDPNSRRMIMITHRELFGVKKTPDKYGLFAEIVELDEDGRPIFTLSTSDVILPNEDYRLAHVGPNTNGLPPSYIQVEKPKEEGEEEKPEFVPWNMWLGQLQGWMNEVAVDPNETFESFINKFTELRERAEFQAAKKIEETFPQGDQGIDEKTVPLNLIITNKGEDSFLYQASVRAGFYPTLAQPLAIAKLPSVGKALIQLTLEDMEGILEGEDLLHLPGYHRTNHHIGVVTIDFEAVRQEQEKEKASHNDVLYERLIQVPFWVAHLQSASPIFAAIGLDSSEEEAKKISPKFVSSKEVRKMHHGWYKSPHDETQYEGLLRKLKADLLLTMFVRGGAPIVK